MKRQRRRFVTVDDSAKHLLTNAEMAGRDPRSCPAYYAGHSLLRAAMRQLQYERAGVSSYPQVGPYHRRPGRRGADQTAHLAEAVQYRHRWQV